MRNTPEPRGLGLLHATVTLLAASTAGIGADVGIWRHDPRPGFRRLALVHPERTTDGFRVKVPLGSRSEWARNVVAAERCRLQLHGRMYELADTRLVAANRVTDLPRVFRAVLGALGVRHLTVRTVDVDQLGAGNTSMTR